MLGTFAWPLVVVPCGAMLGFLPFNWPRARVFLGDGGSQGLGFLLGCASLEFWPSSPAAALAMHALALADLLQVVVVRAFLGLAPWRGDRRHLAHRLQRWLPAPAEAPSFFAAQALVSWFVPYL
jgi:UDP-GlcNAc:undecaprenyl-phosphate GlcNAc-1-phosphate transferase